MSIIKSKYWQFTKKFIFIPLKWAVFGCLSIFVIVLVLLRIPFCQTKIAQFASSEVSEILQHRVTIGHVDLNWIDKLDLSDIIIYDVDGTEMILVDDLIADFELRTIYSPNKIYIENVDLEGANVRVRNLHGSNELNISRFGDVIIELTKSKSPSIKKKLYTSFNIAKITLSNSDFSFDDNTEPRDSVGFDNYHFAFNKISGSVSGFRLIADTVDIQVDKLKALEKNTRLEVCEITTFLRITDNSIRMHRLDAQIGNSVIKDSLVMKFEKYRDFNDFNEKIKIEGNLKGCVFHTKDLAIFDEELYRFDDYWTVSGYVKGTVNSFRLRNSRFGFGKKSFFEGDLSFDGLPNFWQTYFSLKLSDSYLWANDVHQYSNNDFDRIFHKFRYLTAKGSIIGFPTDFVTSANYNSAIGEWTTDLNLKIDSEKGVKLFKGDITTKNLNLGILVDNPDRVNNLNLNGYIEGNGFDPEKSEVNLNAYISSVNIENKIVKNIDTDAIWAKRKFYGKMNIKDSNVVLVADGYIDLNDNVNKFEIKCDIEHFDFKHFGITPTSTAFTGKMDLSFKGLQLDDLVGSIGLHDIKISHEGKKLQVGEILVNSFRDEVSHYFGIRSDFVDFTAKGEYLFTKLYEDLNYLMDEYHDYYVNARQHTENLYDKKNRHYIGTNQKIIFNIHLKDISQLCGLFVPDLEISKNTSLSGSFTSKGKYGLIVRGKSNYLKFRKYVAHGIDLDINTSKPFYNDSIINETKIIVKDFGYNKVKYLDTLNIGVKWKSDSVDFYLLAKDGKILNFDIPGQLVFDKDKSLTKIKLLPKNMDVMSTKWKISDSNLVLYSKNELEFKDFELKSGDQHISIEGFLSKNKERLLRTGFSNFNLNSLNPFLGIDIYGLTNANVSVSNVLSQPLINGKVDIRHLAIDSIEYGNLSGSADWLDNSKSLKTDLILEKDGERVVNVFGYIMPEAEQQLQLVARFVNTKLQIVEPMFEGILKDFEGVLNGNLNVGGTFQNPKLLGVLKVGHGGFLVDYLNTKYGFENELLFEEGFIGMREAVFKDLNQDMAIVSGGLHHKGFRDFALDISIKSEKLMVLNTKVQDNSQYYGTAFASGNIKVFGPFEAIKIEGSLTSLKNTQLHIPIGGISTVTRENYISFVDRKSLVEKKNEALETKVHKTNSIGLKLNLFLTPDAYTEIIFDQKTGDIIRGNGDGKILMDIDTQGEFNMYGDYVFDMGKYNFTMLNVINKDFGITPGSKISWFGDPYAGKLDLRAVYEQNASLLPIASQGVFKSNDTLLLKRKYPVTVKLHLAGELLSPDVNLGIDIKQTPPDINIYVQDFKSRILNNEQELNRQVFSLVMLGRFSEEASLGSSGLISTSLGEFFSNELTKWMSQVDEDLQVDLDLNTVGADGLNLIKLRLSRAFLDKRLKVSVEDGFANTGKSNPNASAAGLAGNWTVEYMILKNGVIRAKIYNRTTQSNLANSTITNTSIGVSIMHTKDFDKFLELLSLKTREEQKNEKTNKSPKEVVLPKKD